MSQSTTLITALSERLAELIKEGLDGNQLDTISVGTTHTYPDEIGTVSSSDDVIVNILFVGGEVSPHHRNLEGLPGKGSTPLPRFIPFRARYLVSIHSKKDDGLTEQQLFTHIMLNFFESPYLDVELPEPYSLFENLNRIELDIELLDQQQLYDLWSILGQEYRTSLAVNIGVIPLARLQAPTPAPAVKEVVFAGGVSGWSGPPEIQTISINRVRPQDIIAVQGQRFIGDQGQARFFLGGKEMVATDLTATDVNLVIPELPRGKALLEARLGSISEGGVVVYVEAPAIYGALPASIQPGSRVTLRGANLDVASLKIRFGLHELDPELADDAQVEFDVPLTATPATYPVGIVGENGESNTIYLEVE